MFAFGVEQCNLSTCSKLRNSSGSRVLYVYIYIPANYSLHRIVPRFLVLSSGNTIFIIEKLDKEAESERKRDHV